MILLNKLLQNISRPLPVGTTEFNAFAKRIFSIGGQYADEDSMLFALSSILIHADSKHGALPDKYFSDRLRKSAANQVASQVFQDIKVKQAKELQEKQKQEELLKKQAEATALPESASNDNQEGA